MSTADGVRTLSRAKRIRLISVGLAQAALVTAIVLAAYYLLPLDRLASVPVGVSLVVGLVVLTAVVSYEARTIARSRYPSIRAIRALAITAPLFLVLFAAAYFLMSKANADNFNADTLTRTDALYFTMTIFSTVGFGDILATSQLTRLMVTVQMVLDLIFLGLGIRVLLSAVQVGRQRADDVPADAAAASGPD
jgi:voltage-gated potassium channel